MNKPTLRAEKPELIEKIIECAMAESSREPDGERLWIKTSYELADILRPILEKELAQVEAKAVERELERILKLVESMPDKTTQEFGEETISRFDLLEALQRRTNETN